MIGLPSLTLARRSVRASSAAIVLGDRPVNQVEVLVDRSRKDLEVDLAVVIDGHDADHGSARAVTGQKQNAGLDPVRLACVRNGCPAEAFVVLCVEVGDQVDLEVGHLLHLSTGASGFMVGVDPGGVITGEEAA